MAFSIAFGAAQRIQTNTQMPQVRIDRIKWRMWLVLCFRISSSRAVYLFMLNIQSAEVGAFIAAIAIILAFVLVYFALIWAAMVFKLFAAFAAFASFLAHVRLLLKGPPRDGPLFG